jgi:Kef-type K+ transport system membrane component KefB
MTPAAYALAGVLAALYLVGELARRCGAPALVGEISVGLVLGPYGLDVVPQTRACTIAGELGLALLVLEGGLHVDLQTLREVGGVASRVAVAGTALPALAAWGLLALLPAFTAREGLLCGVALSSTAIGMAAQLMTDLGLIETELGRVVVTAAMVDDVLSLVLLAVVRKSTTTFVDVAKPVGASAAVVVAGVGLAALTPRAVAKVRRPNMDLLVALALALGAGAAFAADKAGSTPLLGCFVGGVCFAGVEGVAHRFDEVCAPPAAWLYRVFFASIGFVVPLGKLASAPAALYGLLLSLVAVLTKVGTGLFYRADPWKVGWAMVGRGELGFVMALETFRSGRTSRLALSVTVWALLVATLVSPVILRRLLARGDGVEGDSEDETRRAEAAPAAAEKAPP